MQKKKKQTSKRISKRGVEGEGAPTAYREEYDRQVFHLALLGATEEQMGAHFGVSRTTITTWKNKHPAFLTALKKGGAQADAMVAKSLYRRALGYSHKEDYITQFQGKPVIIPTVKHYPPDTVACIFWLKNRQKEAWRDRQEVGVETAQPISIHFVRSDSGDDGNKG